MAKKHSGTVIYSWKATHPVLTYYVTKASKYGTFTCHVTPCEQDIKHVNDWDGYRFAERKCDIQAMKRKAAILRERVQGMKIALQALTDKYSSTSTPLPGSSEFLGDLLHQIEVNQKEYEKVYAQYKYMRDSFSDYTTRIIQERIKLQERKHD